MTQIALLGSRSGRCANFLATLLTLVASVLSLVNGGSNATVIIVSAVLALMAVLAMAVGECSFCLLEFSSKVVSYHVPSGNSTLSPDSMMEIQGLIQKMESDIYTIVFAWRELSQLFHSISLGHQISPDRLLFLEIFRKHVWHTYILSSRLPC